MINRRQLLIIGLLPTAALAHSTRFGSLAIGHAWIQASPTSEASAMVPLINEGRENNNLIGAHCDIAQAVELRDGDRAVSEFILEPGKPFPMRVNAKHLQLVGLKTPLVKGDRVLIKLHFQILGETTLEFHVSDKAGE